MAELERPEGQPDQPVDPPAEMLADAADLAVLAFAARLIVSQALSALLAVEPGADLAIGDAVDGDALGPAAPAASPRPCHGTRTR